MTDLWELIDEVIHLAELYTLLDTYLIPDDERFNHADFNDAFQRLIDQNNFNINELQDSVANARCRAEIRIEELLTNA